MFADGPRDLRLTLGHVIPKTLRMVLDTTLFNTQQYKVRVKSKVEQSKERSSALLYDEYWFTCEWPDTQVENDSHCHLLDEYMGEWTPLMQMCWAGHTGTTEQSTCCISIAGLLLSRRLKKVAMLEGESFDFYTPCVSVVAIEKGAFWMPSTTVANLQLIIGTQ